MLKEIMRYVAGCGATFSVVVGCVAAAQSSVKIACLGLLIGLASAIVAQYAFEIPTYLQKQRK